MIKPISKLNPVLIFLFVTLLLDAIGFGIIIPIMPSLIEEVAHANHSQAGLWYSRMLIVFGIMQFVFGPIIGILSDRFGRRNILLFSLAGMALDYALLALAPNLAWLFVGRILAGITTATQATVNAAISDISEKSEKAENFGILGAAFGIGFIIGPMLGGLLSQYGLRVPFWVACSIAVINLVFGFFVFQETLPMRKRRRIERKQINPFHSLWNIQKFTQLRPFIVIWFFMNFAFFVFPTIWAFYTSLKFDFDSVKIGWTLTIMGVGMAIAQGLLMKYILRYFGMRMSILFALIGQALAFFMLYWVGDAQHLFWILPIFAITSISTPAMMSVISEMVDEKSQGELQGVLVSLTSICMILAPAIYGLIYHYFTNPQREAIHAGAPFLLSALLMGMCVVIFLMNIKIVPKKSHK